ncbi:unnamed protein product [Periconia digitata]|uniref:Methyltransferase domain-containing protein n=1 Tax=Periconia digitata TaxID=1303443 RepID=A0A9W4U586_9PLEO|nr:unnamed protein product [Periconia digitata]
MDKAQDELHTGLPELRTDWIGSTTLVEVPLPAKRILEDYAGVPGENIMAHLDQVRAKALETYHYPCIGEYRFLDLQITKSPAYPQILSRLRQGARLLDVGCCIGQELRQLTYDGVESSNLYGIDLFGDFFQVGYDLFRDRDSFRATMLAADLFATNNTDLSRLLGTMDVVWSGNLLHLFLWERQRQALLFMRMMLVDSPTTTIAGRFMGNANPGEHHYGFRGRTDSMYRHDQQSFKTLCQEVFDGTGERWSIDVQAFDWVETLSLRTVGQKDDTWTLEIRFVITRLS